jgi:hypothetical protein
MAQIRFQYSMPMVNIAYGGSQNPVGEGVIRFSDQTSRPHLFIRAVDE